MQWVYSEIGSIIIGVNTSIESSFSSLSSSLTSFNKKNKVTPIATKIEIPIIIINFHFRDKYLESSIFGSTEFLNTYSSLSFSSAI